jgi:hypothetical protein
MCAYVQERASKRVESLDNEIHIQGKRLLGKHTFEAYELRMKAQSSRFCKYLKLLAHWQVST